MGKGQGSQHLKTSKRFMAPIPLSIRGDWKPVLLSILSNIPALSDFLSVMYMDMTITISVL